MHLCDSTHVAALEKLFERYGLALRCVEAGADIPGSYWGAPEAGLVRTTIHVRSDTPIHSALHEASHVICMDERRRARLHTDAAGEYAEEDAVCYMQIVLAQQMGLSLDAICADMDAWGYTFRLGSARAWFLQDAEDARAWLIANKLLTPENQPTWRCRAL